MKYKAIIFDMDGTIIDTGGVWEKATELLLEKKGARFTPQQRKLVEEKTHGLHVKPSCQLIKDALGLADSVEMLAQELTQLADSTYQKVKFIHGFVEFHSKLRSYNLKSGIATNAGQTTVEITNQILKLDKFFGKHIYNSTHVVNPKPHPDIYLHTAQQLNCPPEVCVVIEDSAHGIKAAKAAGMYCIGINTSKKPELLKEADIIIDGYHEIDLIKLLNLKV